MANDPGITISDAAALLGMTAQGVRDAAFTKLPGPRPQRISWDEVVARFREKVADHERSLESLSFTGQRFGVISRPYSATISSSSGQDLGSLLTQALDQIAKQQETIERLFREVLDTGNREAEMRSGLASSETRVLGLQADLRSANAMIDSLLRGISRARADPDFDFDRPLNDESEER